jgi:hypothetical protein
MEVAPENGKEFLNSAHASGMNAREKYVTQIHVFINTVNALSTMHLDV